MHVRSLIKSEKSGVKIRNTSSASAWTIGARIVVTPPERLRLFLFESRR